ncbi:hypothetical protein [Sphingomonas turrisvirgatae]|uniref:Uncharacterized protein n=1 Tax=Sphingomonas turrisvirgatae TaxID=1888892 RepID=A0A1E3LZT0_9SPHN|nr:hypothetical protein [Sphingomonas turrisvirgatae]ODP39244.1 hypothetical protein BFL28_10545 [Sphingomonas turrisvirgatae]
MTPLALGLTEVLRQWKLIGLGLAIIGGLLLYIMWQGAETRAASYKAQAQAAETVITQLKKRNTVLEREALQKEADDTTINARADELKEKIDEAAKQVPRDAVTDPAARAVGCARLQRSGQTGSAEYRRLCG